jgi:hypothetical protein
MTPDVRCVQTTPEYRRKFGGLSRGGGLHFASITPAPPAADAAPARGGFARKINVLDLALSDWVAIRLHDWIGKKAALPRLNRGAAGGNQNHRARQRETNRFPCHLFSFS